MKVMLAVWVLFYVWGTDLRVVVLNDGTQHQCEVMLREMKERLDIKRGSCIEMPTAGQH